MAVKLSPLFNEATLDSSGNPWTGAQLFTYTAGSSTKQTTYQDSGSVTPHTNPIILNSRGEPPAEIWLTSGVMYKFVITSPTDSDPPVSPTRTMDNVSGVNDTTVTQDQWVSGPAPTFVSTTSFTLVGDQTTTFHVGRRLKTINSGGTIYSIITASAFGALTTVTVVNDSGVLDSGLSAVSYGLLSSVNPSTPLLTDTNPIVSGSADKTKKVRLEVDGLTTATTRVLTVQDSDDTLVGRATTDTLTNKTLTTPTLNGALAGTSLATNAETLTGTDATKIVTPAGLASVQGLVKLTSGSASGATLDIVMTSYTAYKNKLLVIANLIPSTNDVQLFLRTSTDGGSSYASGAGNYRHAALRVIEAGTVTGNGSAGDTEIELMNSGVVSNTQYGLSGNIYLYDTTNTAVRPRVMFDMVYDHTTEQWTRGIGVGTREAAQDTDAIRLLFASGNIASGTYVLYGFN